MKNDRLILSYLRQNGRMQLTKMSRKTNIPVSTLFERLKAYDQDLIKKHTAILDFAKLGFRTRARILLKVNKVNRLPLKEFLQKSPHTNELFAINNGFDFMVEFLFRIPKQINVLSWCIQNGNIIHVSGQNHGSLYRVTFWARPN